MAKKSQKGDMPSSAGDTATATAPSSSSSVPAVVPRQDGLNDEEAKEVLEVYRRRIKKAQKDNNMIELLEIVKELGSGTINNEVLHTTIGTAPSGTILLPHGMTLLEAAKELRRRHLEEETEIDMTHMLNGWDPQDALVNLMRCISAEFGWVNALKTLFSQPTEMKIQIGWNEDGSKKYDTCYMGKFVISAWDKAEAQVTFAKDSKNRTRCVLRITAKKKFRKDFSRLVDTIEAYIKENSIYKGESLMWTGSTGEQQFEYTQNKGTNAIVLNPDEQMVVDGLLVPNISRPGKYICLFSGAYGTGKTETAMRVGRIANANGITFIYARDPDMATLLELSKNYQPCVIFMEDVESIGKGTERSHDMNTLLNTLDGFATKGNDLKVLFTTNHPNQINKALRRAGRLDLIIRFEAPTAETAARIYQVLLDDLPTDGEIRYNEFGQLAANLEVTGSTIAQVCDRARTIALQQGGTLTHDILKMAWLSMRPHIEFMNEGVEENVDHLRLGLREVLQNAMGADIVEEMSDATDEMVDRVGDMITERALQKLNKIENDFNEAFNKVGTKLDAVKEAVDRQG